MAQAGVATFDQLRASSTLEAPVIDNISRRSRFYRDNRRAPSRDHATWATSCSRQERARTPVKAIVRPERARIAAAAGCSANRPQPGAGRTDQQNPDVETLELLEEVLAGF